MNAPWSTAYVYDVENRLVSASGTHNAELVYDPLGRLFQVSSGSSVRRLVYDGDALIAEYDAAGNMPHRYIHGADPGSDDPITWYHNAVYGWRQGLAADHQGSIIQIADMYGNPIFTNSYDEYGIPGANNQGRFGYTGQAWVPELGLWYYKARFYSPYMGRFLQVDPIGYEDQVNLYAYVGNDPVNSVDPSGEKSYVAARPLDSAAGRAGVGHAYVAVNARHPGDPRARVISFGPLRNGRMGNVSNPSRAAGMAVGTASSDRRAWLSMGPNAKSNIVQINAPDAVVSTVANSLRENRPYSLVPNSSDIQMSGKAAGYPTPEVNSNSAAFAVGGESQTRGTGLPSVLSRESFSLKLPGAGAAGKVQFDPEKKQ